MEQTAYKVVMVLALLLMACGAFRGAYRVARQRPIWGKSPLAKTRGEPLRPSAVARLAFWLLMVMDVGCGLTAIYLVLALG
jgi:hypothetical protein